MIAGIGIDLVEVEKISRDIQSEMYLHKVFTEIEIEHCKSAVNVAERFAGRFAAKEAFMKAVGKGICQGVWFAQIEVLNDEHGQPHIHVRGEAAAATDELGVKNIHVSITHTRTTAAAVVILEKPDDKP